MKAETFPLVSPEYNSLPCQFMVVTVLPSWSFCKYGLIIKSVKKFSNITISPFEFAIAKWFSSGDIFIWDVEPS